MAKKSDPFQPWPDWTEAKFFGFLRSGLRAKWSRWPPKYAVLAQAKRAYVGPNPRLKYEFKCAECDNYYPQKQVSVDHIEPAGSLRSFSDLPEFCERLFVGTDKLQVLCDTCHKAKTLKERASAKNKETQDGDTDSNIDSKPKGKARPNRTRTPRTRKARGSGS